MERYSSTDQSPQRAVAPTEKEEEEADNRGYMSFMDIILL
jgi:hypothetical protein